MAKGLNECFKFIKVPTALCFIIPINLSVIRYDQSYVMKATRAGI